MKLALQLLTYNDAEYLPHLLESLGQQTDAEWELWALDNSTKPEQRQRVKQHLKSFVPAERLHRFESETNKGFAGGHQWLFEQHGADLVLLLNVDAFLAPEYVASLRSAFHEDDRLGAASGLIYRWHWNGDVPQKADAVDTSGLRKTAYEAVQDEHAVLAGPRRVFGVSGCLPMYRRAAVEHASEGGELFDPAYFLYKEDVDLAYRLHRGGWNATVFPEARAWHYRTFRSGVRSRMSELAQYHSYRNHLWNLATHLSMRDWLRRVWFIAPYELAKAFYHVVRSPRMTVRAWREYVSHMPRMKQRRRALQEAYARR